MNIIILRPLENLFLMILGFCRCWQQLCCYKNCEPKAKKKWQLNLWKQSRENRNCFKRQQTCIEKRTENGRKILYKMKDEWHYQEMNNKEWKFLKMVMYKQQQKKTTKPFLQKIGHLKKKWYSEIENMQRTQYRYYRHRIRM